ncbi:ABC transporter ATP-binding protein [Murimonas intestini]|uniref:NitT/TauT family transport system ATP-binding protein n=1 Tax=Murimonas intestini TaxID=1337051 RepID=A0AB73T4U7_9FIRM|nr:ABC transporter ATP-binding protein [Murimonas intestini]MCR1840572.1 ABC transporter ATP-binding protein [Murimonas intestini]MCR1865375.1 ABC transporter ATP-binding protein [Murimonas intestini]MCR1882914.1 ABC transporter ATP-binding protein [Murimonas intestini]
MQSLLELEDVTYVYHSINGETYALSNISFQVEDGEFIAIVGPSGCGKSTLLSLISGLLTPESGTILLHGRDIKDSKTDIGYMLQKDHLFEWRTIYSNLKLGLEIQKKDTPENRKHIDELLKSYGLSKFKNAKPSQLSGGMRQRAALIRTLALNPGLLLLDEPFSALDYQTRLSVCDDIASIIKKEHKTAILVTHDLSEAISVADRVIVLTKRPGRIRKIVPIQIDMEERTPMKSRNAPEFKDYFNLIWKELNNDD